MLNDDEDDASDDAGVDADGGEFVAMALPAPRNADPDPGAVAVRRPSEQQLAEDAAAAFAAIRARGQGRATRRADNQRRDIGRRSRAHLDAASARSSSSGAPYPPASVSVVDYVFSRLGL